MKNRTALIVLAGVALLLVASGAAQATVLYTGVLVNSGILLCIAENKATSGDVTISVQIVDGQSGAALCADSQIVGPTLAVGCTAQAAIAYCKVTTSNATNTRGSLTVLDPDGQSRASLTAR